MESPKKLESLNAFFNPVGITFNEIRKFINDCGEENLQTLSTSEVCSKFIIPMTASTRQSYCEQETNLKLQIQPLDINMRKNSILSRSTRFLNKKTIASDTSRNDEVNNSKKRFPNAYICHSWSNLFTKFVATIHDHLVFTCENNYRNPSNPQSLDRTFENFVMWIDLFSNNHHEKSIATLTSKSKSNAFVENQDSISTFLPSGKKVNNRSSFRMRAESIKNILIAARVESNDNSKKADENNNVLLSPVKPRDETWFDVHLKQSIQKIGRTIIILDSPFTLQPLKRSWCLWEIYCSSDSCKLEIAIPADMRISFLDKSVANINGFHNYENSTLIKQINFLNSLTSDLCLSDKEIISNLILTRLGGSYSHFEDIIANCIRTAIVHQITTSLSLQCDDIKSLNIFDYSVKDIFTLNSLAYLYDKLGDISKSEEIYYMCFQVYKDKILSLERKGMDNNVLSDDIPIQKLLTIKSFISLNNIAVYFKERGKYDRAKEIFMQACEWSEMSLGEMNFYTLFTMKNLADFLSNCLMDFEKAEYYFLRIYKSKISSLGWNHVDTLTALESLLNFYKHKITVMIQLEQHKIQDNIDDAKFKIETDKQRIQLGEELQMISADFDSKDIITNNSSLKPETSLSLSLETFTQVEAEYLKIMKILNDYQGAKRNSLLILNMNYFGIFNFNALKFTEAKDIFEEAYAIASTNTSCEEIDNQTLAVLSNLAISHEKLSNFDRCEQVYQMCCNVKSNQNEIQDLLENVQGNNNNGLFILTTWYNSATFYKDRFFHEKEINDRKNRNSEKKMISSRYFDFSVENFIKIIEIRNFKLFNNSDNDKSAFDDLMLISSLNHLGYLYYHNLMFEKAAVHLQQLFDIKLKFMHESHLQVISLMNTLGIIYTNLKTFRKAEFMLEKCLNLRKKILGEDHFDSLVTLHNLATMHSSDLQIKSANFENNSEIDLLTAQTETLFTHCYKLRKEVLGDFHEDTLATCYSLANFYFRLQRYDNCLPLYSHYYEVKKTQLGENDIETLSAMNNLASVLFQKNDFEDSKVLFLKCYEFRISVLGELHADTLSTMINLATIYHEEGNYDEAEILYLKYYEAKKSVLGDDHPDTLEALNSLAVVYFRKGYFDRARLLYDKCYAMRKEKLGEQHPDTKRVRNNMAILFKAIIGRSLT